MTFREWLNKMYGEYTLELEYENIPTSQDIKEYFRKNKWWLRREYRKHVKNAN